MQASFSVSLAIYSIYNRRISFQQFSQATNCLTGYRKLIGRESVYTVLLPTVHDNGPFRAHVPIIRARMLIHGYRIISILNPLDISQTKKENTPLLFHLVWPRFLVHISTFVVVSQGRLRGFTKKRTIPLRLAILLALLFPRNL